MGSNELNQLRDARKGRGGRKKPCHYCGGTAEVSISMQISEGSSYTHDLKWLTSKQVRACASCATTHLERFA